MRHSVLAFFLVPLTSQAQSWVQTGASLNGQAPLDKFGTAVHMPDVFTLAVGAPQNDDNGADAGHVRVYLWDGIDWVQKGADIQGAAIDDHAGAALCMPDANTIAVASPYNSATGIRAGHVRVFMWDGNAWVQKGQDLEGEVEFDNFGCSVSMPDANTLAVGAEWNSNGNGSQVGEVSIFTWDGSAWVQKGVDLPGDNDFDKFGHVVSMPTSDLVAIAAPQHDGGGIDAGMVRVYAWSGTAWVQQGADLLGEATGDQFGTSLCMADSTTLAVGAEQNDGGGLLSGHARVFAWNGSAWAQKGADIDGEALFDYSGAAVSMPDANTVAIGAGYNDGQASNAGSVRVFAWNGVAWVQQGADINGTNAQDLSGLAVSMPDANTVAIGAVNNLGSGNNSGQVNVYDASISTSIDTRSAIAATASPNPTVGPLTVLLPAGLRAVRIHVTDVSGKEVEHRPVTMDPCSTVLGAAVPMGLYTITVTCADGTLLRARVIKQ